MGKVEYALLVPDVHNDLTLLTYLDKLATQKGIRKLIFLGDYEDSFNELYNGELYLETISALEGLKNKFDCTFLVGNHDVPYLLGSWYSFHFSCKIPEVYNEIGKRLTALGLNYYTEFGGYLISHAGILDSQYNVIKDDAVFSEIINPKDICHESILRGISADDNSFVWIRPMELSKSGYKGSPQIVGHTPQLTIIKNKPTNDITYIDTWSRDSNKVYVGDRSLLILGSDGSKEVVSYYE